jgi:hypothetical protein
MAKLTGFNILLVLFVAAGGFTYGFAFSVFVSSVGQPAFYTYFGLKGQLGNPYLGYIQTVDNNQLELHTLQVFLVP